MPNRYDTEYQIGQDNLRTWGMDFHNPVFIISALLVLLLLSGQLCSLKAQSRPSTAPRAGQSIISTGCF